MIPIAALLNVDTDEEEKRDSSLEVKAEPVRNLPSLPSFRREVSSATSAVYTSSDEEYAHTPEEDAGVDNQFNHERGSLTATEASSLLGALTLQKLKFATPTAAGDATAVEPSVEPARAYLSMASLTNPVDDADFERGDNSEGSSSKPLTPGQEARAARRRSTRALFPGSTDEDRRAKQRMIVKRCYYKKINTINDLREQVQQLEQVFQSVLEEQETQREEEDAGEEGEEAMHGMLDQYVGTVKDKEVLRQENQRLRKLADEYYMKNQGRLRVLLDTNRKEMTLFTPALSDE